MLLFLRLAFRNLGRHPWRTSATALGIGLGIAAVLATLSIGDNVEANVRATVEAATGKAALLLTPGPFGRIVFDVDTALDLIDDAPGVTAAYPVLNYRAEPLRDIEAYEPSILPGTDSGFLISGRLTQFREDLPTSVSEGLLPQQGSYGMAVAEPFADARGIVPGDTLTFATRLGPVDFTVTGLLDGSLGLGSTNGGRVGVVHLTDLQEVVRLEGSASFIELMLAGDVRVEDVQGSLENAAGDSFDVVAPAVSGTFARGFMETIQAGLSVLAVTLMALGGFLAYNTFAAATVERTGEYALLRTVAYKKRDVQALALLETAMVSILGLVLGLALGVTLAYIIARVNTVGFGYDFRTLEIPFPSVLVASLIGVVVALIAGWLPARTASRTPPRQQPGWWMRRRPTGSPALAGAW